MRGGRSRVWIGGSKGYCQDWIGPGGMATLLVVTDPASDYIFVVHPSRRYLEPRRTGLEPVPEQ